MGKDVQETINYSKSASFVRKSQLFILSKIKEKEPSKINQRKPPKKSIKNTLKRETSSTSGDKLLTKRLYSTDLKIKFFNEN